MRWVVPWPCSSLFSLQLQFLTRFRKTSRNNVVPTENTNYDIVYDTTSVFRQQRHPNRNVLSCATDSTTCGVPSTKAFLFSRETERSARHDVVRIRVVALLRALWEWIAHCRGGTRLTTERPRGCMTGLLFVGESRNSLYSRSYSLF
jgi:hypothetical protein